jgi:hypothetical protein
MSTIEQIKALSRGAVLVIRPCDVGRICEAMRHARRPDIVLRDPDWLYSEAWRGFVYPAIERHRGLTLWQSLARKLEEARDHCCLRVGASA